jgi:DNA-binding IclR family transcriptional regulator
MIATKPQDVQSALRVLNVLDVLMRNFAHGFSLTELSRETGYDASSSHRYVETLITAGYAERIPETGRIRPSHRIAQQAVQVLKSLDSAADRIRESQNRLNRG